MGGALKMEQQAKMGGAGMAHEGDAGTARRGGAGGEEGGAALQRCESDSTPRPALAAEAHSRTRGLAGTLPLIYTFSLSQDR